MMPICAASCTCVNPRSLRMRAMRFPSPSLPKSIGGNFRVDFFGIGAVYGLELKTLEAIRYDTLFMYTVKKTRKTLDRFFGGGLKMARIPEDEVERLKREVSVQRL